MFLPLLTRLVPWLPDPLRRRASPARIAVLAQFGTFGCVGLVGFVFDTATVYATRDRLGLYGAGTMAYLVAATVTWVLNRIWTFRGPHSGPMHRQWGIFLATNALGFLLNRGTYALLITLIPVCATHPVLAIAAGCLAGMFLNFHFNRKIVFRESPNN
ncbi:MAG: GtrA family protein [Acetobacteraceae bacterium]|nr:GtrA family protein [Acetobacteraceae bacterium]